MKALRLIEVLLPMLAARGWAPWQVDPDSAQRQRVQPAPTVAVADAMNWREQHNRRPLHDDVQ